MHIFNLIYLPISGDFHRGKIMGSASERILPSFPETKKREGGEIICFAI